MLSRKLDKNLTRLLFIVAIVFNVYLFSMHFLSKEDWNSLAPKKANILSNDDERIDWHNHEFMKYEANRVGPGEQTTIKFEN